LLITVSTVVDIQPASAVLNKVVRNRSLERLARDDDRFVAGL